MSDARPNLTKRPANARTAGSIALAPRPKPALYAVYAIAGAAVLGAVAWLSLFFSDAWIRHSARYVNDHAKAKDQKHGAALTKFINDQVSGTHKNAIAQALVLVIALAFISLGVYKGRHWSRWGTTAVWFLLSIMGSTAGLTSVLGIAQDRPGVYKGAGFVAGVLLLAAVVLVNLRPSTQWFALSKPAAPASGARRNGLFGPRPAPRAAASTAGTDAAAKEPAVPRPAGAPDRSRSKKRVADAQTASVARGADLARTRAKAASKSRRTEA